MKERFKQINLPRDFYVALLTLFLLMQFNSFFAQTYNYSYMPEMGSYTNTGSGSINKPSIDYNNSSLAGGTEDYTNGQIKATVYSHNSTTISFRVAKTSGFYKSGNSGKIFILDNYYGDVYPTSFYISNSSTSYVTAKVTGYEDFSGTRTFEIFLITSDKVYKQYGGKISITGSKSQLPPTIQQEEPTNITSNSAIFSGVINPNGSSTTWYFKYGTSISMNQRTNSKTIPASYGEEEVSIKVTDLSSNNHYYVQLCAENSGGTSKSDLYTFDTDPLQNNPPSIPSNPYPSVASKDMPVDGTLSWNCSDPDGDAITYKVYKGTSKTNIEFYKTTRSNSCSYSFEPATEYYWYVEASDGSQSTTSPTWNFKTKSNLSRPTNPSPADNASDVDIAGMFSWNGNNSSSVTYTVWIGTSSVNLKEYKSTTGTSLNYEALELDQNYFWKVVVTDGKETESSALWKFKTKSNIVLDNCPFPDCPGGEICEASTYLYNLGILEGVDGKLLPDDPVTRAQLAKLSLYSLYSGPTNIPSTLVSDKFPSIYPDLQDPRAYYYRPAKALLYLEYQDGVSPFDRNRSFFNPEKNIERNLVLKVICETFNIKPETSTSNNPFSDFDTNQTAWGYAKKCYDLGIAKLVNTTKFRPLDACKRKEAILYLYRVLTSSKVTVPKPRNAYTPSESSFFIPANLSAKTMGVMKGIEAGNFNFYQKDFFNIDGYMPLDFGVTYNSCLTELPSDFYPVSPMGTAWSHTYNAYMTIINDANNENKTIVFHNADGSMLLYNYDDLESQTEGNYFTLERQQSSRYTLTSPGGTVYTFVRSYAADNIYYLTTITDRNENTLTITYEDGVTMTPHNTYIRRVKTVSTLGRDLTFAYTSGTDLLKTVTDPSGRMVSFTYSGNNLASLKDAKGQTTSFTYGTSAKETSLLKSITLPKGNVIKNGYYQRKLTSTQYNKETPTRVKVTTNYTSGTTNTEVIQPVTSNDSITTKIKLDGLGRVKSATDNDKNDVSMTYGDVDNSTLPTKIVDNKTGITTTLTYNKKGKVTKRVISSGGSSITEKYSYTPYNDIESYTDANGNITKYEYTDGNLTSVTDAMGNVTNITNNSNGAPTAITDPMGRIVKMQYNSYGNVNKVTQSALSISTSFGYDNISRITSTTDLNGKKTSYKYDKNDNVVSVTDPLNNTTLFTFDANDNLTKITNAKGKETTLTYDDDDLLTEQSFQGSTKSFTYNIDGSLSSSTSANGDIRDYSYDESGDIIDDDYASYTYNSKGWLSSIEKDGKSIDYYYDALGRVSSEEYDGQEVGYDYDDNGNVTSITYPGDKTVTYTYDALNRVTAVTDWNGAKTTYSYNDDGSINYVQLPNKVRTTYTYDKAGRVTGITTKRNSGSGTAIAAYTFTMDKMGNHLTEKVTEPYGEIPDPTAGTTNYTYNAANRVTKAGDISFAYDKNGNATSRTGRTMKYDIINNLTKVTGDFSATYTYDGLGNRRSATRGGTTTKYVLRGNNVIAETNSSNKVLYYYVYGPTGLIARITPSGTTRYYVSDYRGSVVAMTDATTDANVTHQYQYDDFGQVLQSHEENTNLFRYVGVHGVMHETNGLTFMRARYYDPTIGRFNSEDPIWSTNLYPYADNNPIMGIDNSGNITQWIQNTVQFYKNYNLKYFVEDLKITLKENVKILDAQMEYELSKKNPNWFNYWFSALQQGFADIWIEDEYREAFIWCTKEVLTAGLLDKFWKLTKLDNGKFLTRVFGKTGIFGKFGWGEDFRYATKRMLKKEFSSALDVNTDYEAFERIINIYAKGFSKIKH